MIYKPSSVIQIGNRRISKDDPVYFVADIGSNFDGELNRARELIYLAKEAGADAAKFQHYNASSLVSDYGFRRLGSGQSHQKTWKKSVYETYKDASLNREWTAILKQTCDDADLTFFTSPYALELVDFVDPYVSAYKIGSGDITWPGIIEYVASKGKPVFLATGASGLEDVQRAVATVLKHTADLVLMQCNTNYTANNQNYFHLQLNVLRTYETLYPDAILGLSDHMPGHVSVLGAVALGALVIEKHFTDSNQRSGPDHFFAMTPVTWREMVERSKELKASLGDGQKRIEDNELETAVVQRRCVRACRDLVAETVLSEHDLTVLRPCPIDAVPPCALHRLLGKRLLRNIVAGEHLQWNDVQ